MKIVEELSRIKEQTAIISRGGTVTSPDCNVFTFHLTTVPYGQFITRLNTNTRANNEHLNSLILLSVLSIIKRTNSIFFFIFRLKMTSNDITTCKNNCKTKTWH